MSYKYKRGSRLLGIVILMCTVNRSGAFTCKFENAFNGEKFIPQNGCTEMVLSGHSMSMKISQVVDVLISQNTVETLDLWSTGINEHDSVHVARLINANTVLKKLYLNENPIGSSGSNYISDAIRNNTNLRVLFMSRTQLKDEGAIYLLSGVRHSNIETLDLWENDIGDDGGMWISKMLEFNIKLRTLELQDNPLGDKTARALSTALRTNKNLNLLNIIATNITAQGAQYLDSALAESPSVPYLTVLCSHFQHNQKTSWESRGFSNAP